MNKIRWSLGLGVLGAVACAGLQLGFHRSGKAIYASILTTMNFAVIPVANWIASKCWPRTCVGVGNQALIFEMVLPILSGLQWMLIGRAFDLVRPARDRARL
ncbi:MAG TPA: hypothetical protein VOA41_05890 [Candidatus Dormibacteraeota bacterium]|nr:hypothetical protein [Candidatus Dormibacteraeota bacterium]